MLSITVSDDGRGVELERLRQKIVSKQLTTAEMAESLTEAELVDFVSAGVFHQRVGHGDFRTWRRPRCGT